MPAKERMRLLRSLRSLAMTGVGICHCEESVALLDGRPAYRQAGEAILSLRFYGILYFNLILLII
ncbi:hypothetical protein KAX02_04330 [candidate division WOR-3 bacterium]|nr:hypothetical protein [candidate division WOR-3 bacterium]